MAWANHKPASGIPASGRPALGVEGLALTRARKGDPGRNLQHGMHSPRLWEPIARAIVEEIRATDPSAPSEAVERYAQMSAIVAKGREYLATLDPESEEWAKRAAHLSSLEESAHRIGASLGLDPVSRAKRLQAEAQAVESQREVADLLAEGAEILEQVDEP